MRRSVLGLAGAGVCLELLAVACAPKASDGATRSSVYVDAGPPAVQLVGRFDTRDPAGPKCGWPGCRILARFEGPSVSVDLAENDEDWMDGAPSEWDVAVDGAWGDKIVTTPGVHTYPLASGLGPGPHQVELYKRTEAQNGVTQLRGFDFGGGRLVEPPLRSTRRIEIIGDSVAAGFGIEGVGFPGNDCPGLDHSAGWQNFRKSFGALLGKRLDAEVHATVYSGKGLAKNIWRLDKETMPRIFSLANPVDFTSTYDFAWKADVVVMMMGGNDFSEGQPDESEGNGPATPAEFLDAYRSFVETLRTHYPQAHVILAVSPSVSDERDELGRRPRTQITSATTTVALERQAVGDARISTFAPGIARAGELAGCNGHGTPAFHERLAEEMTVVVKEKTGW